MLGLEEERMEKRSYLMFKLHEVFCWQAHASAEHINNALKINVIVIVSVRKNTYAKENKSS